MTAGVPCLTALQGRRLLLSAQALLGPAPTGLAALIDQLGFVQVDSINVLERAHHLILGCRLEDYRPAMLERLLHRRRLFEHWTHDAAIIPMKHYRHWKVRFPRSRARILANAWWRERVGDRVEELLAQVLDRIRAEGPLRSADFDHSKADCEPGWWGWKPQKAALEMLWHTGELAVAGRVNFHKRYDLAERVFPKAHAQPASSPEAHRQWACSSALERLGVASPREIAAFWDAVTPAEAAQWCATAQAQGQVVPVELGTLDDGPARGSFAPADWRERLANLPDPNPGMRILCPFDPILRDRARCLRLFGFDYRFEAFVPEAKRQYGYYVLPLLEGDTLIGRMDAKLHRDRNTLAVKALWWEKGIRPTQARLRRLNHALEDLAVRLEAQTVELPGVA